VSLAHSLPEALYRVDPGPLADGWPPHRRHSQKAQSYRSKGHAVNRLKRLRKLGWPSPSIHEAPLSFVDITGNHP